MDSSSCTNLRNNNTMQLPARSLVQLNAGGTTKQSASYSIQAILEHQEQANVLLSQ
jgi:hypothetical protein